MLTDKQRANEKRRQEKNKLYRAFVPKFKAILFDEILKNKNQKFSNWLNDQIDKEIRNNKTN